MSAVEISFQISPEQTSDGDVRHELPFDVR